MRGKRKFDWIKLPQGSDYHGNGRCYSKLEWNEWPKLPKSGKEKKKWM